ncbi:MAG: STAS domain-containing protein, partial [Psychromonas sp.]
VIPGITLAVLLGLFQFLRTVMRPTDQVLGLDSKGIMRSIDGSDKAKPIHGVFIYRFNSPLTYFNAVYFKRRLLKKLTMEEGVECIIVDAVPCFTHLDLSVMGMLSELHILLKQRGVRLVLAGRKRQMLKWCELAGVVTSDGGILIRSDLYLAVKMNQIYKQALAEGEAPKIHKQSDDMDILPHSLL